jgi:CBS domain-containing protein
MSAGTERPLDEVKVARTASIKEALARLDEAGTGALVVVDAEGRLYGLLTDGDVRRAILRGVEFDRSCGSIASRDPIVARGTISAADALHTMIRHDINHLLLLDEDGTPERLLLRNSLTLENDLDETARKRRESVSIDSSASITDALARLDKAGTGALVVVDEKGGLFGLLTDGDIRRAILRGVQLEEPCGDIASRDPIVVRGSITAAEALHIMAERDINHLLLLDERGQFAELLLRRDLIEDDPADLAAVVMAGGFGTRLYPLTLQTPKPMLPVGDRPLLERMLRQLRRHQGCQFDHPLHAGEHRTPLRGRRGFRGQVAVFQRGSAAGDRRWAAAHE